MDRSPPTEDTLRVLELSGIAERAKFIQGAFFTAVPGGGDLYLLKSIIHNWDDPAATIILGKCRGAMPDHARLVVAERVVPPANSPSEAKLFDITVLVSTGGKEPTEAEYGALFRARQAGAGASGANPIPSESDRSVANR